MIMAKIWIATETTAASLNFLVDYIRPPYIRPKADRKQQELSWYNSIILRPNIET